MRWGGVGTSATSLSYSFRGSPRSESLQNSRALWSEMRVIRLISITGDQSITCIFSKVCSTMSLVWAPTTPPYPTPKALVLRSHLASLQVCRNSLAWFSTATLKCNDSCEEDLGRVKGISPVFDFTWECASMGIIFKVLSLPTIFSEMLSDFLQSFLVFAVFQTRVVCFNNKNNSMWAFWKMLCTSHWTGGLLIGCCVGSVTISQN